MKHITMNPTEITSILITHLLDEKLIAKTKSDIIRKEIDYILETLVEELKVEVKATPKTKNEPIMHDGEVLQYYCRYHQRYEPLEAMITTKAGKNKGYCKAGYARWNLGQRNIKKLNLEAIDYLDTDIELAQTLSREAKEIKERINNLDYFNWYNDWNNFKGEYPRCFETVEHMELFDNTSKM